MANLVAGLIEVLEQEQRLQIARKPSERPAIAIPTSAIAAYIMCGTVMVIPIERLIEVLKKAQEV